MFLVLPIFSSKGQGFAWGGPNGQGLLAGVGAKFLAAEIAFPWGSLEWLAAQ
jgi:hypothetical protein